MEYVNGIIYITPQKLDFQTANVLDCTNIVINDFKQLDNEKYDFSKKYLSRDAFLSKSVIQSVIGGEDDEYYQYHNLIIPRSAIDDELYSHLSKIDIGHKILDEFKYLK